MIHATGIIRLPFARRVIAVLPALAVTLALHNTPAVAEVVPIEIYPHHMGDGLGNEGVEFEQTFFMDSGLDFSKALLEIDFSTFFGLLFPGTGTGPSLEYPPVMFINGQSVGSLVPFFPPLDLSDPKWQTNPDGSPTKFAHDYNGPIHAAFDVGTLLQPGANVFRLESGRPDDDYWFENVLISNVGLVPEPTSFVTSATGILVLVLARRRQQTQRARLSLNPQDVNPALLYHALALAAFVGWKATWAVGHSISRRRAANSD